VATVVATVVVALAVSFLQTPVYQASATLLLQSRASEQIFAPESQAPVRAGSSDVLTEIGVMESRSVRQAVAEELGRPVEVSIQAEGETDLVTISVESVEAAEAAQEANTYAEVYITSRRQQLVADLQIAIDQVQAKITEFEGQLDDVDDQPLADLDTAINAAGSLVEAQPLQDQRNRVQDQVEDQRSLIESQQGPYITQLGQLQLATNLTQTGGAQIVGRAEEPTEPIRPTPLRNGALALVVGAMLGVGLAFLREHLDDTIKTKDDLQQATQGTSVLGLIPSVESWNDRTSSLVVSLSDPNSAAAEAYRSLRTAVQFIGIEHPLKVIQFTSPNASEGKTTTLANLAVALARAGQRVVVVCCDLRRPRVHEFFGLEAEPGFTSVLLGETSFSTALQAVKGEGDCALLAAGPTPPNPSELLSSRRTEEVITMLKNECDVVLIDTPPMLPVTDALVVSRLVDATIVVVTAGRTTRKELHRSIEMLHQVSAPLVGTVLNGVEPGAVYGSGNRYNTYYRKVEPQTDEDDELGGGGNSARVNGNGAGPHAPSPVSRWRRGVARFSRP
jgi:capsular exopolysaccharide synthesis family protein